MVCLKREDCAGYIYPMCVALNKLKDSNFAVTISKQEEEKLFNMGIKSESFVMMTEYGVEGQIVEDCKDSQVEVNLKGKTLTSLFKIMTIPGTGFMSKYNETYRIER